MAKDLFNFKNVKNNVHRSSFDLQELNSFTAKAGELLPVYNCFTLPGDKFTIKTRHFTRTRPLQTSAFVQIKEYFDWFWVPMRQLWKNFPTAITQMTDNYQFASSMGSPLKVTTDMPYLRLSDILFVPGSTQDSTFNGSVASNFLYRSKTAVVDRENPRLNMFGYSRFNLMLKLLSYLGYGNFVSHSESEYINHFHENEDPNLMFYRIYGYDVAVNIFPLLAYNKIYNDFYRNSQWEKSRPYMFNVDYSTGGLLTIPDPSSDSWHIDTMFDLKYANYEKDLFYGILPKTQEGDISQVIGEVYGDLADIDNDTAVPGPQRLNELNSKFDILKLRQSQFLQKWKEIAISGSKDYKSQIQKHFGVTLPNSLSNLCQFIGGDSNFISINEVVNTNLNYDYDANIKGTGTASNDDFQEFEANDYGVLMCIYHAKPIIQYATSGISQHLLSTNALDFPIPEMDSIGLQALPTITLINPMDDRLFTSLVRLPFLGYTSRYINYKTGVDRVNGDFTVSQKDWCAPITDYDFVNVYDGKSESLNRKYFKIYPGLLNPIFAVKSSDSVITDQFLVNANFDIKAVRNLDYNGLPY